MFVHTVASFTKRLYCRWYQTYTASVCRCRALAQRQSSRNPPLDVWVGQFWRRPISQPAVLSPSVVEETKATGTQRSRVPSGKEEVAAEWTQIWCCTALCSKLHATPACGESAPSVTSSPFHRCFLQSLVVTRISGVSRSSLWRAQNVQNDIVAVRAVQGCSHLRVCLSDMSVHVYFRGDVRYLHPGLRMSCCPNTVEIEL